MAIAADGTGARIGVCRMPKSAASSAELIGTEPCIGHEVHAGTVPRDHSKAPGRRRNAGRRHRKGGLSAPLSISDRCVNCYFGIHVLFFHRQESVGSLLHS